MNNTEHIDEEIINLIPEDKRIIVVTPGYIQ